MEKDYFDVCAELDKQKEQDIITEAEMFKFLNERGTFTGSRAYGIHNNDSDYDYALNKSDFDTFYSNFHECPNVSVSSGEYMVSVYYSINGKTLNVFCVDYERLKTFKMTTEMITLLATNPDYKDYITNKEFRVMFFRNVESMLKLSVHMKSEEDNNQLRMEASLCQ